MSKNTCYFRKNSLSNTEKLKLTKHSVLHCPGPHLDKGPIISSVGGKEIQVTLVINSNGRMKVNQHILLMVEKEHLPKQDTG